MPQISMEAKLPLNVAHQTQGLYKKKLGTTWYSSTPSKHLPPSAVFLRRCNV